MKLNITQSTVLQTLGTAIQIANAVSPSLSIKQQGTIAVVVGVMQIIVNRMAHKSNPDGTPATVAYVASDKL